MLNPMHNQNYNNVNNLMQNSINPTFPNLYYYGNDWAQQQQNLQIQQQLAAATLPTVSNVSSPNELSNNYSSISCTSYSIANSTSITTTSASIHCLNVPASTSTNISNSNNLTKIINESIIGQLNNNDNQLLIKHNNNKTKQAASPLISDSIKNIQPHLNFSQNLGSSAFTTPKFLSASAPSTSTSLPSNLSLTTTATINDINNMDSKNSTVFVSPQSIITSNANNYSNYNKSKFFFI